MRRPSRTGLSWLFVLCANIPSIAQNLQSIGKEKLFSFSGGLAFNQIFYASRGLAVRRDPYNYFASGNVNLSVYGWNIPLAFSVSNRTTTFSQPFNQYSLHPTWKWITAHAGYTSMSFSPYTMNGHIFFGAGVDLTPGGIWKLSAFYGRLLKAVETDTTTASRTLPAFQRKGYGLKAVFGNARNSVDLILFRAQDDEHSIGPVPDSLGITPQQNLVVSVGAAKTAFKHFLLKAELATSAITKDTRAEKTTYHHPLAKMPSLFQPRLSSSYYQALKTSFDYQHKGWTVGIGYERIDPEYRTLGAYYFNNDLENLTLNTSAGILKGKMNIAGSTGIQRDNLDKNKMSTMRRMVGSLNVNYMPSEKFNLSASYSSFQTYTNIRSQFETINQLTPYDYSDTLNFTQISRNASLTGMFTLAGRNNRRQNINLNLTWQDADDKQGDANQHSGSTFSNITAGYSLRLVPENTSLAFNLNASLNESPFIRTRMMGPSGSLSRSFLSRKLRTTFSSSWNRTYSNGATVNRIFNIRLNGMFSILANHNINLSAVLVHRTNTTESGPSSALEFTSTLGYNCSFAPRRK